MYNYPIVRKEEIAIRQAFLDRITMISQEQIFCYKKRKSEGKEMNHQVVDLGRK